MTKIGQKVPSGEVILSWTVHSLSLYTGWKHLNEVTSSVRPSPSEKFLLLRPCRKACHETFTPFWEQFLAAPCGFHQIFSILHALVSWNIRQEGVVPLPCEGHVLIQINMIAKSFQDTSRDHPSCNFCHISYPMDFTIFLHNIPLSYPLNSLSSLCSTSMLRILAYLTIDTY
jgi:hypothetical protein